MATKYRYRLLFYQHEHEVGRSVPVISDPVEFSTPLSRGECISLPAHLKQLEEMPTWILKVEEWDILQIVHRPRGARVEEQGFAMLAPAPVPYLCPGGAIAAGEKNGRAFRLSSQQ